MKKEEKILSFVVLFFVVLIMFLVSLIPFSDQNLIYLIKIKSLVYHFGIFFFFGSFLHLSFQREDNRYPKLLIALVIFLGIIYSIFDELNQSFVLGRYPSVFDIFIDLLGVICGALFVSHFKIFIK